MGWRGALRAIAAAQRRAHRESEKRYRELQRTRAQLAKTQEHLRAAHEVEDYENLVARLTSVHRECADQIDWQSFVEAPPPIIPAVIETAEREASERLDRYQPSLFDRLLRRTEQKRQDLTSAIERGRAADAAANSEASAAYAAATAEWKEKRELAHRVLGLHPDALVEALRELDPFSEISALGSTVNFNFHDAGVCEVTLHVNSDDVVPKESKSLLKSGRVSIKKMSQGQFWEIYQDYVAGAVLRVSRELFAAVPVRMAFVSADARLLNSATGQLEDQTILSVKTPRETMDKLNFSAIDPSDALRNFVHRCDFRRTKGLAPVERLSVRDTTG